MPDAYTLRATHRGTAVALAVSTNLSTWTTAIPIISPGIFDSTAAVLSGAPEQHTAFYQYRACTNYCLLLTNQNYGAFTVQEMLSVQATNRHCYSRLCLNDLDGNQTFDQMHLETLWLSQSNILIELTATCYRSNSTLYVTGESLFNGIGTNVVISYETANTQSWGTVENTLVWSNAFSLAAQIMPALQPDDEFDTVLLIPSGASNLLFSGSCVAAAPPRALYAYGNVPKPTGFEDLLCTLRFTLPQSTQTGDLRYDDNASVDTIPGFLVIKWTDITGHDPVWDQVTRKEPIVVHYKDVNTGEEKTFQTDDQFTLVIPVPPGNYKVWVTTGAVIESDTATIRKAYLGPTTYLSVAAANPSVTPVIELSNFDVTKSVQEGSDGAFGSFSISNSAAGILYYRVKSSQPWLIVHGANGDVGQGQRDTIPLAFGIRGFSVGTYTGTITVANTVNGDSVSFVATITIVPNPAIAISPTSIALSIVQGQTPASQSFEVWNSSQGTLHYSIADDANWMNVSPSSGQSAGEHNTITISFSGAENLTASAQPYVGHITVTDTDYNTTTNLTVALTVIPETLFVSATSYSPVSSSPLVEGVSYEIEVSGTFSYNVGGNEIADAEFCKSMWIGTWAERAQGWSEAQDVEDLLINNTCVNWLGSGDDGITWQAHTFSTNHIYRQYVVGTGAPLSFAIADFTPFGSGYYYDNSGGLTVTINRR